MSLIVSSAPSSEPVTLAETKLYIRVDHNELDAAITEMIVAARAAAETFSGKQFLDATYVYKVNGFPHSALVDSRLLLPRTPVDSVSSVTYLDTNGDSQTLATSVYEVDTSSLPGRIRLKVDQTWPNTQLHPEVVTITFVAGYGTASDVPGAIKLAIKMIVADIMEHPEWRTDATPAVNDNPTAQRLLMTETVIEFA